jgi:hypothetical protein
MVGAVVRIWGANVWPIAGTSIPLTTLEIGVKGREGKGQQKQPTKGGDSERSFP